MCWSWKYLKKSLEKPTLVLAAKIYVPFVITIVLTGTRDLVYF